MACDVQNADAHMKRGSTVFRCPAIAFKAMARRMTWFNNYDPGQSGSALYLTDGASDDNAYGKLGVPAFTWELGSSFFDSCTTFNSEWPGNLDALRYAARIVQAPYLRAAGPDVHTVAAMPAAVDQGTPVTISAEAPGVTDGKEETQSSTSTPRLISRLKGGARPSARARQCRLPHELAARRDRRLRRNAPSQA